MMGYSNFMNYYISHNRQQIKRENIPLYVTYLLANFCMPTLLKQKPSVLLRISRDKLSGKGYFLKRINDTVRQFECECRIIYQDNRLLLLLIYNRQLLTGVISDTDNRLFLSEFGYDFPKNKVEIAFLILKHRFLEYYRNIRAAEAGQAYPHEIGILLGFPVGDVRGFIQNKGKNYLYCGYWKVYHDLEKAMETFNSYQGIRESAWKLIMSGRSLQDMKK